MYKDFRHLPLSLLQKVKQQFISCLKVKRGKPEQFMMAVSNKKLKGEVNSWQLLLMGGTKREALPVAMETTDS